MAYRENVWVASKQLLRFSFFAKRKKKKKKKKSFEQPKPAHQTGEHESVWVEIRE